MNDLAKILKVMLDKPLRSADVEERIKEKFKNVLPDYKVIICQNGMDIKPLGDVYYGLRDAKTENWVLDDNGNIKWYPCKQIADADAEQMTDVEVKPFNAIKEVEIE